MQGMQTKRMMRAVSRLATNKPPTLLPAPVELALADAREKYRALFESEMMGIVISDLDEAIIEANDAFLSIIGYTREDLARGVVTWSAITPGAYKDIDTRKVRELLRHGAIVPFEKGYIHKKGHEVPVLVGATRIRIDPPLSVCFALDISELKKLQSKKDEFIGTVSHELQTPLAVLKMQVSLLRDELHAGSGAVATERSLGEIDEQITRLSLIITDLLNLARFTGDRTDMRAQPFDLRQLAAKVASDTRLISRRTVLLKAPRTPCFALGHHRQVARVITNLLMNALRYSPEHKKVVITVSVARDKACVSVEDFGIGIEKALIPKIFNRFYRAKREGSFSRGSSGIGLHVAREIARENGGSIKVVSAVGKGSTFTLELPAAPKR